MSSANGLHAECKIEVDSLTKEKNALKTELDAVIDEKISAEENADKIEILESELKQYKSELMELKVALGKLEVKV